MASFATTMQIPVIKPQATFDHLLVFITLSLILLGAVMITSASMEVAYGRLGNPFFYAARQFLYVAIGLIFLCCTLMVPINVWERTGVVQLAVTFGLLALVLIIGREINGSVRWINLGVVNLQASEVAKLCLILYLAGYLVRRSEEVRNHWRGFMKPMLVIALAVLLLLLEPDFGAVVVLLSAAMGMMFLAGVKLYQFLMLILACGAAVAGLAVSQPYRLQRLVTYIDPWEHQFDSGYQLTQSLIAFGRGEWFGTGLGNSIQKIFYLPEAHTDFVFAVAAEELGVIGAGIIILLLVTLCVRALVIGYRAEKQQQFFGGYAAYGIGLLFGMQTLINIGVNTGLLPTKGLTLPMLSYGGSSLVISCVSIGLLLRIDYERRQRESQGGRQHA
ncbi:putative lipid II flippase FtsW [Aestuariirhabdus sp. Z084]|uniref:putative lipid II flippase FtsW n=1 Tax=Aestuariirhabdus haliotis TaxID=2918751 RepID=UPI00201B4048|nr:putative lipid II flippase FtsW [Aestuariirhabdus haliotis]MCL6415912.1 putative lipid II flippase FtsW [Aestuariirhabdus haliotis]MCL6419910.1 putative lipid II flippase FtsW [Aestuariirhabdus haliotis]